MKNNKNNNHEKEKRVDSVFSQKLKFTFIILSIYMLGRCVPLYGVDVRAYAELTFDAGDILLQAVSGDAKQYSLFAVGLSPYLLASLFVSLISSIKRADKNVKVSPKKISKWIVFTTLALALFQSKSVLDRLIFVESNYLLLLKIIAYLQLLAGAIVILWLSERNKKYGIGSQTILIFINIADGIMLTLTKHSISDMKIPLIIAACVAFVALVLENTEKRIPLQRISIHNIYADKNYLAIKFNPIGIMPMMFASSVYLLPKMLVEFLANQFPNNMTLAWWKANIALGNPLGIGVYVAVLYLLTLVFSMIMLNPKELTDNFLKSGDSILNLHAGKDTRRYLNGSIIRLGLASSTIMGICVIIPMMLQLNGKIAGDLAMFPTSAMMLTGIFSNVFQEAEAIRNYDSYHAFL